MLRSYVVPYYTRLLQADIKYLDYGGYHTLPWEDLKQIRTDFLSLPFQVNTHCFGLRINLCVVLLHLLTFSRQAIECYLANISPKDDENVSAFVLEELIAHQIVQARMIGTNESGVPMIHLYRAAGGQTTMVNRELVDRRCALWLETTIVQLETVPSDQPASA
jgi:A-kinase anchor protein 1